MSPHAVNNFVSDLVLMAQAMERLPQIEADLANAKDQEQILLERIANMNADLEQSRSYAASLEQKVRETEASRDDAELRFLELDERAGKALDWLADIEFAAEGIRSRLMPPTPQPVPEGLHSEPPHSEGNEIATHSESIPQVGEVKVIDDKLANVISGYPYGEPSPQGQSAADPTPNATLMDGVYSSGNAISTDVNDNADSWASPTPPDTKPQPYAGKNYFEWPGYVEYGDWLAGGGTHDDYWPRRDSSYGEG